MAHNLDSFLQQYRTKTFAKGQIILSEGEVPPCAYVIKRGVVKTHNITGEGQEKPISFDIEGEVFPVAWVFGKLPHAQYYYEAFVDCELYCLPREDYIAQLKTDPELLFILLDYFVKRYLNYQMRVHALEQSKAADKVLHTLHFLSLRFGRDVDQDVVEIQLPLTQQGLADFMGLTRETAGIELKKLSKAKVISYNHQRYLVHTDKLDDLLDEAYDQARLTDEEHHVIKKAKA